VILGEFVSDELRQLPCTGEASLITTFLSFHSSQGAIFRLAKENRQVMIVERVVDSGSCATRADELWVAWLLVRHSRD
jgi:hypothetical protein